MQICKNCGTPVTEESFRFCSTCGAKIQPNNDSAAQNDSNETDTSAFQSMNNSDVRTNRNAPNNTYNPQNTYTAHNDFISDEYNHQSDSNPRNSQNSTVMFTMLTAQPPSTQNGNQYGQNTGIPYQIPQKSQLSMSWFKFLIYFALFAGAVINLAYGINYLTGMVYTISGATPDTVYGYFGTSLRIADIIYGISLIASAALSIYTRMQLAKFKANGPKLVLILYIVNAALSVLYLIAAALITGEGSIISDPAVVTSTLFSISFAIANKKYFDHRKEMFNN